MTEALTNTQSTILLLLLEHGMARFQGQRGRVGRGRALRYLPCTAGGVVIEAYQTPEFFLLQRGLIERVENPAPGSWYRLSAEGRRRAERLVAYRD